MMVAQSYWLLTLDLDWDLTINKLKKFQVKKSFSEALKMQAMYLNWYEKKHKDLLYWILELFLFIHNIIFFILVTSNAWYIFDWCLHNKILLISLIVLIKRFTTSNLFWKFFFNSNVINWKVCLPQVHNRIPIYHIFHNSFFGGISHTWLFIYSDIFINHLDHQSYVCNFWIDQKIILCNFFNQ